MAITFKLKAGTVPASKQCLSTLQGVLKGVEQYVEVISPPGYTLLVISADQPAIEDRDKAWLKLNNEGYPIELSTWHTEEDAWVDLKPFPAGIICIHSGLLANIPEGWTLANGIAPATKNLTTYNNFWEGGDGGNAGHYSVTATTYTICPIEFIGY